MTTSGSIVQNALHPKSFNNIRIGEEKKHSRPKCGDGTNDDDGDGDDNKDKNDDDDARIYEV